MACSSKPSVLLILFVMTLLAIAQVTVLAARPAPTTNPNEKQTRSSTPPNKTQTDEAHPNKQQQTETKPSGGSLDKKDTECFDQEGTVVIPGVGRYMIGSHPQVPTVGGTFTGDSVPAAINPRYVPGNDDTFVPNPGYEVPNPFRGSVP